VELQRAIEADVRKRATTSPIFSTGVHAENDTAAASE
jgi:hypothetical protein